ncbi:succinate dehydrogenase, hydrophobic membrane anchor protein [Afifella pfennigii]|uniref:succinate dehydrogenase, hydrophobic membrane anchor protein n=1 Tax=Afifella pfennigii TaxID=209897 RepID=UPI00047A326F|nr:succinate dehydrogenase, hydrophobic membrane anchor protein [Afifella pfennigii]
MRTMLSQVRGLGSAGIGTDSHLIRQRITAYANIPLIVGAILVVVSLIGADYETARQRLSNPLVAALLVALILNVTIHMRLGMQSVIEDYVHHEGLKAASWIANWLYTAGLAVVGILSILIIALGG